MFAKIECIDFQTIRVILDVDIIRNNFKTVIRACFLEIFDFDTEITGHTCNE